MDRTVLSRELYQRYHRLILELALGGLSGYARCSTGCASLRSVLDTIDIFRIAPKQLAVHSNSRLRSCLKARPKRACYGGRLHRHRRHRRSGAWTHSRRRRRPAPSECNKLVVNLRLSAGRLKPFGGVDLDQFMAALAVRHFAQTGEGAVG